MADVLRIKRRTSGAPGAPASLGNAEIAFNEVDNTLYYGWGGTPAAAANVIAIAGVRTLVTISDTAPASPLVGSLWFDSVGLQLYIYFQDPSSSQWTPVVNQTGGTGLLLGAEADVVALVANLSRTVQQLAAEVAALRAGAG